MPQYPEVLSQGYTFKMHACLQQDPFEGKLRTAFFRKAPNRRTPISHINGFMFI
jgi:hypothetical protein